MIVSFLDVRVPYIYKNRQILLPWVEDWTKPQNHIRNLPIGKKTDELRWIDWFFCHPSAYTLFYYSLYISGFFSSIFIGTISLIFWSKVLAVILYIFAGLFAFGGIYKKNDWKKFYGKTFYDTQMRDYK